MQANGIKSIKNVFLPRRERSSVNQNAALSATRSPPLFELVMTHMNGSFCRVRRQGFWHQELRKLRECPAHLVGLIMRRVGGDASAALRVSYV
jgi:hypothetical protein